MLGDHEPLAVGAAAGLLAVGSHQTIALEPAESRVQLPELERTGVGEHGVVLTLQLVPVTRFALQKAEQGERHAHGRYSLGE